MRVGILFVGDGAQHWADVIMREFPWNNLEIVKSADGKEEFICDKEDFETFGKAIGPVGTLQRNAGQCRMFDPTIYIKRNEAEGFIIWWEYIVRLEREAEEKETKLQQAKNSLAVSRI